MDYTKTEKALMLLAEIFFEYAAKSEGGNHNELDRNEMELLLKNELVHFLQAGTFEQFDLDENGSVTFTEFMKELANLGELLQGNVKKAIDKKH